MGINANRIGETLKRLGLTERESKVYLFLANCKGPQKGGDIAIRLRIHKGEIYRILTSLQSKCVVETTLDHPMGFIAVPFEKVLDLYIKKMEEQIFNLKVEEKDIIAKFKSATSEFPPMIAEKFSVIKGRDMIFAKSFQLDREAKKEILWMSTGLDELKYDQKIELRRDIKFRTLSNITEEDLNKLRHISKSFSKLGVNVEARYADLGKDITFTIQIQDNDSALIILEPKMEESVTALWTNSKVFIRIFRLLFEKWWSDAISLDQRVRELEKQELKVRQKNNNIQIQKSISA